jgi:cytochrome d ubiquinol oxidase subunit II
MSWLSGFSVISGVALSFGYALSGAGWVARKCEGKTRDAALRSIPKLTAAVLLLLIGLFLYSLLSDLTVMHRWMDRPVLFVVLLVALLDILVIVISTRRGNDALLLKAIIALFICAYAMFAISFWPYLIPFSVTFVQAAAPASSLSFMFWGAGLFIFPLMLIYTFCSYYVFRGKVGS